VPESSGVPDVPCNAVAIRDDGEPEPGRKQGMAWAMWSSANKQFGVPLERFEKWIVDVVVGTSGYRSGKARAVHVEKRQTDLTSIIRPALFAAQDSSSTSAFTLMIRRMSTVPPGMLKLYRHLTSTL